ncbi:unnamed protein product [Brachionus calyciflorus]|uniref:Protein BCCIP homolog n=1 Tax=Brachionus calyciflorus TaxID=104777 RepID=A0A813N6Z3_9BILA|nr:unnamed protein product [Brachionus calyciflorus]
MPLKKKQKAEEQIEEVDSGSSYDEDSGSGSDQDEDIDPNEEIMVDFEARSILESDRESIKVILQQKLGHFQQLNVHELATIISQQENLGNVINQVDDEEGVDKPEGEEVEPDDTIFGVLSMVDLTYSQTKNFSLDFIKFLKSQTNAENATKLDNYVKNASYIVNERFLNIPPGISVPMFESLLEDVKNLSEDSANKKTDYWLFLARVFVEDRPKGKSSSKLNAPEIEYSNPEEEIFEEFSEFKFDISYGQIVPKATGWSKDDSSLTPCLRLLVLNKNKVNDALEKIKNLIK